MSDFISMCISTGLPFVGGLFLLGIYFSSKNDLTGTDRKSCLTWAIFLFVGSAILAGATFSQFSQCTNPDCNEWVNSAYCQKCGWEVNATVDCPTCEKEFGADKVPAFCPDCGTAVSSD